MKLITVYAMRFGTSVNIYNTDGTLKAIFHNRGYRPTKRTKRVKINGYIFNLKWK